MVTRSVRKPLLMRTTASMDCTTKAGEPPTCYVCHAWSGGFKDLVAALREEYRDSVPSEVGPLGPQMVVACCQGLPKHHPLNKTRCPRKWVGA